jgi:hypothetical protein
VRPLTGFPYRRIMIILLAGGGDIQEVRTGKYYRVLRNYYVEYGGAQLVITPYYYYVTS